MSDIIILIAIKIYISHYQFNLIIYTKSAIIILNFHQHIIISSIKRESERERGVNCKSACKVAVN